MYSGLQCTCNRKLQTAKPPDMNLVTNNKLYSLNLCLYLNIYNYRYEQIESTIQVGAGGMLNLKPKKGGSVIVIQIPTGVWILMIAFLKKHLKAYSSLCTCIFMKYISSTFQECLTDCTYYTSMFFLFNGGGACLESFNEYLLKKCMVVISVWLYAF